MVFQAFAERVVERLPREPVCPSVCPSTHLPDASIKDSVQATVASGGEDPSKAGGVTQEEKPAKRVSRFKARRQQQAQGNS